jgi:hypothetical protein
LGEIVDLFTNVQTVEHAQSKDLLGRVCGPCYGEYVIMTTQFGGTCYSKGFKAYTNQKPWKRRVVLSGFSKISASRVFLFYDLSLALKLNYIDLAKRSWQLLRLENTTVSNLRD